MRYNEIKSVILEYKREPTARSFGAKIINRVGTAPAHELGTDLYNAQTIIRMANNPQSFSNWGLGHKKMQFDDYMISVGVDNAKEILEQIQPVIIDKVLQVLEQSDPTQNKVFVPWLAREWSNGNIKRFEDIDSRLRPLMQDFVAYKNKKDFPQEAKDIMRLNAGDFERILSAYQPPESEQRDRGQAETLLDNSEVRVIHPQDERSACYYGQGTRWCTAATRGQNMFSYYNSEGPMYIILPKKPKYEGEKYQLHFYTEQFMDENDDSVDLANLIQIRFPSLEEFFKKREPAINQFIMFADDETIVGLWRIIGEFADEYAFELYGDWEANDDGFYSWQREYAEEKGYTTDDGEIDYDALYNDDNASYDNYNDDARRFLKDVNDIYKWEAFEIREFCERMNSNGDIEATPSLTDMEEMYAAACESELSSYGDLISEHIQSKITVSPSAIYNKGSATRVLGTVGDYVVTTFNNRPVKEDDMSRRGFLRGMLGAGAVAAGLGATDAEASQQKKQSQVQQPKKITPEESRAGHSPEELKAYVEAMAKKYLPANQVAQFVGQIAHETANFTSMIEQNPEKHIKHYAKPGNPLGNKGLEDAWKYIGRGFLQITGRYNYKYFGDKIRQGLGDELLANPNMAMRKDVAIALAVMFWRERVAPKMAAGASNKEIAKAINGKKPKGLQSREKFVKQAAASTPVRKV